MSWGRFSNFNPYQGPARAGMRRCPAPKPGPSTVVVLDEDDDGADASDSDVFIIDPAVAAAAPWCHASKGNGSSGNVINIDDDEDVGEGTGWDKARPSTSRAFGSPASVTPGRGSPGSRYGLDSASGSSESDLSEGWDSDIDDGGSSDCEILDDTAREMWETAASRKKMPHGVHECEDGRATAFTPRVRSEAQPDKNSEGLFGAGCYLDEIFSAAECHLNENIFQRSSNSCKGGEQNNTGGLKGDHGHSSPPNAKECSNGEGVVLKKTSEVFQSPLPGQTSAHDFASANRVFPGSSSTGRKDGSPPISVSTPEKIDEKIPEGVYSLKDQSPPEAYINRDMYSARDDCSVRDQQNQFASVIGDREKHKESIEYKRAAEEEWASRQRQLQIQAEEAKKLRKRKKAEAQRLLDMEKRQKQRLQEVRESQRKNEEAIQLKEQYRGVVRKELEDMERRYLDMTSILHALGIPVEGGEVKAYKQALLKFHPDRVSRSDIYQQVKAEETFKFISRLKEKLPRCS